MGEYAIRKSDRQRIKIGTCSDMYYLRFEDRYKVQAEPNNVDVANHPDGLRFRLPFPDEDNFPPGAEVGKTDIYNRALPLPSYTDPEYPDHVYALSSLRAAIADDGRLYLHPVIRCLKCEEAWRAKWVDVLPHLDNEMRSRLDIYRDPVTS